jgi:hypothetical protein
MKENTTLSEQFRNYGCLNYSYSVVFFYMITELFWKCGIFLHNFGTVLIVWYFSTSFRNCSESVVFFYINSELFWQCGTFRHHFGTVDSVVFFYIISELLWQCGIFLHYFWTALTVLYFSSCICTRPGEWTVMYLCVRSIGVCISSRILLHDFGIVLTVWYFST